MRTGHALILAIIPIFLEGCCVVKHQTENIQEPTENHYNYRAVQGDVFMMPCVNPSTQHYEKVVWSRHAERGDVTASLSSDATRREEEGVVSKDNVLTFPALEAKHSGNYTCRTGGRKMFLHLQVLEKAGLGCPKPEGSELILIEGKSKEIPCPAFTCGDHAYNTDVTWHKNGTALAELQRMRGVCKKNGSLFLCTVYKADKAVFFCDRNTSEQGVLWINRRAVSTKVIPMDTKVSPVITHPRNETEEVEIGQPYTLTCNVTFGFERNSSSLIQWYSSNQGTKEDMILMKMESPVTLRELESGTVVTRRAVIEEVTSLNLNHTYTCIASNAVGNSSATIKLKRKTGVKWPAMVAYPTVTLVLVAGLGVIVYVKWLELSLLYRSHWPHENNGEDEKEFDVFLSYVWSPLSEEVEALAMFSPSRPDTYEEASPSSMDHLTIEEGYATQTPLEVLLPQVLEDQWGYRLCLLERDLLPGGAYTEDVVHTLQRSRMLICLLSADYLSSSNAMFVLESGIQALLQGSHLKLLLIWMRGKSACVDQLNPALPTLVRRALRVLPALVWAQGEPAKSTSNFWRSLRTAMPIQSGAFFTQIDSEMIRLPIAITNSLNPDKVNGRA
ncbi:interleukin-18 receptor accessory protein-like [Polymixia lowei]